MKLDLTQKEARLLKRILGHMFCGVGENAEGVNSIYNKLDSITPGDFGPVAIDEQLSTPGKVWLVEELQAYRVTVQVRAEDYAAARAMLSDHEIVHVDKVS